MHICFQNLDSIEINEIYNVDFKEPPILPQAFFSFIELYILVRYVNYIIF